MKGNIKENGTKLSRSVAIWWGNSWLGSKSIYEILGCMKKKRLSPPSKNCFISRYIHLVGGSGIIEECENQSNCFYLKKWPLTTVLSDIQKPNPGKTFCSSDLWHIPPQSSNSLPKLVKIMEKT